jgi:protoporphyrinogen oxidase
MAIVVVGAGVTGLSVAERLLSAGKDVLVLEKEPVAGGLCRSYQYGDFIFDVGPHRLFSSNARIQDYFLHILDEEYSFTSRDSMVYMNRKYLAWPLSYSAVFHLPPADMFRCLRDLVLTDHRAEMKIRNLEDDIVSRSGQTIYRMFWKDYTEKFLRIPCDRVDAAWGNLSVKRSVVDGRTQPLNLMALIRNCVIPRKQDLSFIYPNGGMGVFPRCFMKKIENRGGKVLLSQSVERIVTRGDTITGIEANGVAYPVEALVWTGLLPDVCSLLQVPPPELRYLSTILYNLEVERTYPGKWQWIYFPDKRHVFSRISMPARFSRTTVPPGKSGLCVEVARMAGDEPWTHPETLIEQVMRDLADVGLVRDRDRISGCHLERVPNTYPVYETGFAARTQAVQGRLAKYKNLHLVGRQASFVHDNIDESIENALRLAEQLA